MATKRASQVRAGDRLIMTKTISIKPYEVSREWVVVSKVESYKGRIRVYYGTTSVTLYPNQEVEVVDQVP